MWMRLAFDSDHNSTKVGICIRDHNGNFVLAKTVSMQQLLRVKEGEARTRFTGRAQVDGGASSG